MAGRVKGLHGAVEGQFLLALVLVCVELEGGLGLLDALLEANNRAPPFLNGIASDDDMELKDDKLFGNAAQPFDCYQTLFDFCCDFDHLIAEYFFLVGQYMFFEYLFPFHFVGT